MADITQIPTSKMKEDYSASKLDYECCKKLLAIAEVGLKNVQEDGGSLRLAEETASILRDRVSGNAAIMAIIKEEMERRGEEL